MLFIVVTNMVFSKDTTATGVTVTAISEPYYTKSGYMVKVTTLLLPAEIKKFRVREHLRPTLFQKYDVHYKAGYIFDYDITMTPSLLREAG